MTRGIQMLILLVTLLSAATAQSVSSEHAEIQGTFSGIEWRCDQTGYTDWNSRYSTLTRYRAQRLQ
jgi:hypothetical protein